MLTTLFALTVALLPIVSVAALLELAGWWTRRRQVIIARQIALTDAIWSELGAVVSPVVKKPLLGPWRIQIAVPVTRPTTVGTILSIAHRVLAFADRMSSGRYQLVLTPQPEAARTGGGVETAAPRASAA